MCLHKSFCPSEDFPDAQKSSCVPAEFSVPPPLASGVLCCRAVYQQVPRQHTSILILTDLESLELSAQSSAVNITGQVT